MTISDFSNLINYVSGIALIITFVLLSWRFLYFFVGFLPAKKFKETENQHTYAILIPARNESKVIKGLLNSIKNQNYPADKLQAFVIVESLNDPTCEICKEFPFATVFCRQELEKKGKGYAMDECIRHIKSKSLSFDGYIILDADNVIEQNFVHEMNKAFDQGYEITIGNRDSKNWNDNWVSVCSTLIFSIINKFQNKCRARMNCNIVFSGTGMLVSKAMLDEFEGWPFHTLTEDYEISAWATLNNKKTTQVMAAKFYDESPTDYATTKKQRIRWIKGFQQTKAIYQKKLIKALPKAKNKWSITEFVFGVVAIISLAVTTVIFCFGNLLLGTFATLKGSPLALDLYLYALMGFGIFYLFFFLYTLIILIYESKNAKLSFKNFMLSLLLNPFYSVSWLELYIKALYKKEVAWAPIEHKINIETDETKEMENLAAVDIEGLNLIEIAGDENIEEENIKLVD